MSPNKLSLEKQLTEFYRSNKDYFLGMEKSHDVKYYEPVLNVLRGYNLSFKEKKVLDVGSGTGTFLKVLKKFFKNSFEAVGVDISSIGRGFHKSKGIKFYLADAQRLPFRDESFDFVFSIDTLEHIINPQKAIFEMYRITKNGGLILIRTRNYRSPLTTFNFISVVKLIRDLTEKEKDLRQTERLKPVFSASGGDRDAVSAIYVDQLRSSLENLPGELLTLKTWTKGGLWKINNHLPLINLMGSMCLVLFKKG